MKSPVIAAALLLAAGAACAKLPSPTLTPEAQLKAAEAAQRSAWSDKVAGYQLCKAMDRVAASYHAEARRTGQEAKPATPTPPCTDPGAFVFVPPQPKPLEAAGAHSPPATASTPPNTAAPQAAQGPAKR